MDDPGSVANRQQIERRGPGHGLDRHVANGHHLDSAVVDLDNVAGLGPDYANPVASEYFNHRKISIYGGSNEIQKGIITKAILGL